jgi:hypothetical protein
VFFFVVFTQANELDHFSGGDHSGDGAVGSGDPALNVAEDAVREHLPRALRVDTHHDELSFT